MLNSAVFVLHANFYSSYDITRFVKWTETQLKCARPVAEEEQAIFVSALYYALVELKSKRIRLSDEHAKVFFFKFLIVDSPTFSNLSYYCRVS